MDHRRRELAFGLLAWGAVRAVGAQPDVAGQLRAGGCALLLRHARTTPGVGDPPGFALGQCSTQRNLSEEGQAQARSIGAWFHAQGRLQPRAVRSSAWCRCRDTATLAFGGYTLWPPLNSTFGAGVQTAQAAQPLRDALRQIPSGAFEVWVTHQVNITGLTGEFAEMGEGLVLDSAARSVARSRFG